MKLSVRLHKELGAIGFPKKAHYQIAGHFLQREVTSFDKLLPTDAKALSVYIRFLSDREHMGLPGYEIKSFVTWALKSSKTWGNTKELRAAYNQYAREWLLAFEDAGGEVPE